MKKVKEFNFFYSMWNPFALGYVWAFKAQRINFREYYFPLILGIFFFPPIFFTLEIMAERIFNLNFNSKNVLAIDMLIAPLLAFLIVQFKFKPNRKLMYANFDRQVNSTLKKWLFFTYYLCWLIFSMIYFVLSALVLFDKNWSKEWKIFSIIFGSD